ncbi:MAG: hypothetical protein EOM17_03650 [Synergistales bacterium]|nr:hypothetical protein [Synergistales bacterium]
MVCNDMGKRRIAPTFNRLMRESLFVQMLVILVLLFILVFSLWGFWYAGVIPLAGLFLTKGFTLGNKLFAEGREGRRRFRMKGGHAVILGWDKTGPGILRRSLEENDRALVFSSLGTGNILSDMAAANIRPDKKLFLYNGNYADGDELNELSLESASRLYILGDAGDPSRDSRNIETAVTILDILEKTSPSTPLDCFFQAYDLHIFNMMQGSDFFAKADRRQLNLRLFNFYEEWARRLWSFLPEDGEAAYPPLAYDPQRLSEGGNVHLVIAGFGTMGQALAVQAIRICHYANGAKTRITAIDRDMERKKEEFVRCFPILDENGQCVLHDVEMNCIATSLESPEIRRFLKQTAADEKQLPTVAVCFSDVDGSLSAALSLPLEIKKSRIPVLIRQEGHTGLRALKRRFEESRDTEGAPLWSNIHYFGGLDEYFHDGESTERSAMFLNALYHVDALSKDELDTSVAEARKRGFGSLEAYFWAELDEKFRWSNRYQAAALVERLRVFGCALPYAGTRKREVFPIDAAFDGAKAKRKVEEIVRDAPFTGKRREQFAEAEHDRWWAERTLAGWEYADATDRENLKHADLRPYDELPPETRRKDLLVANASRLLTGFSGEATLGSGEGGS